MVSLILLSAAAALPINTAPSPPVTSRDLVEVADISGPVLAPDGRRVAFRVTRPSVDANETLLDWFVADAVAGRPIHVGSGGIARHDGAGAIIEQAPVWDPDSRGLRFTALVDGVVAIWHWREGSTPRREVIDDADILGFDVSTDGRTLRYSIGATRAELAAAQSRAYEDGVLVDERVDMGQALAGGMIVAGRRTMQRFPSNWFDRAPLLWDHPRAEKSIALGPASSGVIPQGADAVFAPLAPAQGESIRDRDDRVHAIEQSDDRRQVVVTAPGKQRIECTAAICRSPSLVALARVPQSETLLLFERAGNARERVWNWTIGSKRAKLIAATDGGVRTPARLPRCVAAKSALVCAASAPTSPPRLVRYSYGHGREEVLLDPNAGLRARISAVASPIELPGGHSGILLRPARAKGPVPLVVHYNYCAGFMKGGVGDEIPMIPLAQHGIAILCIDRARPPAGAPMEATYEIACPAIEASIDRLASAGIVDPKRVGIGGLSYASQVVTWCIRRSKRFAAATISSGQLSPNYYWTNAVPDRGFAKTFREFWKVGDPDSDPDRWRKLSPLGDIAALDTPLLMQLPESEVRNVIELHTKLKRAGKPAELFAFADEIHIKYQPVHKRAVYERNLDWYRFWLGEEEDDNPAKAEQYRRWRALRAGPSLPVPAS
jgi:dipeptidyl aminopeptidase/acylaminoacyl peptidase